MQTKEIRCYFTIDMLYKYIVTNHATKQDGSMS